MLQYVKMVEKCMCKNYIYGYGFIGLSKIWDGWFGGCEKTVNMCTFSNRLF